MKVKPLYKVVSCFPSKIWANWTFLLLPQKRAFFSRALTSFALGWKRLADQGIIIFHHPYRTKKSSQLMHVWLGGAFLHFFKKCSMVNNNKIIAGGKRRGKKVSLRPGMDQKYKELLQKIK